MFKEQPKPEKTALVVDDSRSARYAMRKFLESAGYTVDTAESAQDAYVYLQRRHPQMIFLDHQMPGSDGLDVLRVLKDDATSADIPVVLCSGQEDESLQRMAQQAGAVAVLPKPPDADQLKSLLGRLAGDAGTASGSTSGARRAPSLGLPPTALHASVSPRLETSAPASGVHFDAGREAAQTFGNDTSIEIQALRRTIDQLQRELRELKLGSAASSRELLKTLEAPIHSLAQRAVAQALQQAAEQILRAGRDGDAA